MKRLRDFSKMEEAHLCAAWLRNRGIDASVIDESGYGGNMLGVIRGSIRIEVPDSEATQARTLLIEYDQGSETTLSRFLVTGGAGFIGSHLVETLLAHDAAKVVVVDCLTYAGDRGRLASVEKDSRFEFVESDAGDPLVGDLMKDHNIDCVYHLAAETHVDRSITGPDVFRKRNIDSSIGLFNILRDRWHAKQDFVALIMSTDEVYGSVDSFRTDKLGPWDLQPGSPYAASKAAVDLMGRAYESTYGLPVVFIRPCNIFGPRQFSEKLIPFMINRLLEGQSLPLYGDGNHQRDWLYVDDLCRALVRLPTVTNSGECYDIGGTGRRSNLEVINDLVAAYLASPFRKAGHEKMSQVEHVADRPGHDFAYPDASLEIGSLLDWKPEITFQAGLQQTMDWYLESMKR